MSKTANYYKGIMDWANREMVVNPINELTDA